MRTRIHENQLTGTLTIEADSPEMALSEAAARLGPGVAIDGARRVSRGGVAGFFARERFQVRARAEGRSDVAPSPWGDEIAPFDIAETPLFETASAVEAPIPQETDFGSALVAALSSADDEERATRRVAQEEILARVAREDQIRAAAAAAADETVGTARQRLVAATRNGQVLDLRDSAVATLDPPPPPPPPPPADPSPPPAPAADRAVDGAPSWRLAGPAEPVESGMGRVNWGRASLVKLGLPTTLVEALADIDVRDDLGWINTIADVVAPLCRQLPPGPGVMVGSGTERIAARLGLGLVRAGDTVIPDGSWCASVADTPADIEWLERTRGNRNMHLVIGDEPWMHLLVDDPASVSYTTDRGVVDALYVAITLGVPLGYGTIDGSRKISRIDAIDVALTVRRLVGRK